MTDYDTTPGERIVLNLLGVFLLVLFLCHLFGWGGLRFPTLTD